MLHHRQNFASSTCEKKDHNLAIEKLSCMMKTRPSIVGQKREETYSKSSQRILKENVKYVPRVGVCTILQDKLERGKRSICIGS